MITNNANTLILNATIAESIDNIDVISLSDIGGETFRKTPQNIETISLTERKYTFYLTEAEANATIIKLALIGNGATITLGDGTEMATQKANIIKTNTQSLLIHWNIKVVV